MWGNEKDGQVGEVQNHSGVGAGNVSDSMSVEMGWD